MKREILTYKNLVYLYPTHPFNFQKTIWKPSHFPEADLDYKDNVYWQTFRYKDKHYGIKMTDNSHVDNPIVKVIIFSKNQIDNNTIKEISTELGFRFNMHGDLTEFYNMCYKDKILGKIVSEYIGMKCSVHSSLYEFLVVTTVLQNVTIKRSIQMFENLFIKFGTSVEFDGKKLYGFWAPKDLANSTEQELRILKLGYRAKTLMKQAIEFVNNDLDEYALRQIPTDKLRQILLKLYGIGPASVQNILFEVFKRFDVLEYLPLWEQKICSKLIFNDSLIEKNLIIQEINQRWDKWNMLGMHYIIENLFWKRSTNSIDWFEKIIYH